MIRFVRDAQPPYTNFKKGMVRDLGPSLETAFIVVGDAVGEDVVNPLDGTPAVVPLLASELVKAPGGAGKPGRRGVIYQVVNEALGRLCYWDGAQHVTLPTAAQIDLLANNVVLTLCASGVPVGRPPAGTMAANGAVTFGTAFDAVMSGYFHFDGGQIFSGSPAGKYWTVMSSTTVGVVYNNVYSTGEPTVPETLVPIVAAGPGAFTFANNDTVTLTNVTVPGGSMRKLGSVELLCLMSTSAGAGGKTWAVLLGGQTFFNVGLTDRRAGFMPIVITNCGVTNRQVGPSQNVTDTTNTGNGQPPSFASVETQNNQILELRVSTGAPTEWFLANMLRAEVKPNG